MRGRVRRFVPFPRRARERVVSKRQSFGVRSALSLFPRPLPSREGEGDAGAMSGLLLSASLLPLAARVEPDGLAASSLAPAVAADGLPASSYDALQDCARIWHDAREFTSVNRPRLLESYFTGVSAHAEKTPHTLLIHIGKAAGTSLLNFYSKNDCFGMKLPDAECQAPIGPFGFNKDSLNRRCCAPFFTEVHALPTSPMALQANPRVVVMLRDPVERFVSAFNTHACLRDALGHKKRMLDCMRVPKDASEDLTPSTEVLQRLAQSHAVHGRDP